MILDVSDQFGDQAGDREWVESFLGVLRDMDDELDKGDAIGVENSVQQIIDLWVRKIPFVESAELLRAISNSIGELGRAKQNLAEGTATLPYINEASIKSAIGFKNVMA